MNFPGSIMRVLPTLWPPSRTDGETEFDCEGGVCYPSGEPAGVWADEPDRRRDADINNHRIVEVPPRTRTYGPFSPRTPSGPRTP